MLGTVSLIKIKLRNLYDSSAYCSVAEVNLVADDNKRKVFGISWTGLDEELVPPALQRLERVWNGNVVDENAAVGTAVERNAEALESFLSRRVPDLP